jgi:secreted trypsin-like serine protease
MIDHESQLRPFITKFFFKTSINMDGNHFCGGSIYDAWNVLTAAHCCDIFETLSEVQVVLSLVFFMNSMNHKVPSEA